MWKELCEANANHYVDHPGQHAILTGVVAALGFTAFSIITKKITEPHNNPYL